MMADTLIPRDSRSLPMEEAVMPLPRPDITPPLTKINFMSNQREPSYAGM